LVRFESGSRTRLFFTKEPGNCRPVPVLCGAHQAGIPMGVLAWVFAVMTVKRP
jgi:hypothetical protein